LQYFYWIAKNVPQQRGRGKGQREKRRWETFWTSVFFCRPSGEAVTFSPTLFFWEQFFSQLVHWRIELKFWIEMALHSTLVKMNGYAEGSLGLF
jgi:hypothetical protein